MEARAGDGGVRTAAACSGIYTRVQPSRSPQDIWNPPGLLQPLHTPVGLGLRQVGSTCGAGDVFRRFCQICFAV